MYLSFEQLVLLLLLAFILFGPEKLPEYAAKLGRLVKKLREASQEVVQQVKAENPLIPNSPTPSPYPQNPRLPQCPHCQKLLGTAFVFCPYCGQRVKEAPASKEPSPPQDAQTPAAANPYPVSERKDDPASV